MIQKQERKPPEKADENPEKADQNPEKADQLYHSRRLKSGESIKISQKIDHAWGGGYVGLRSLRRLRGRSGFRPSANSEKRNRQKGLFRVGSHRLPYPEPPLPTVSPGSQGKRPPQMPCNRFLWPPHIPPWLRGEKAASGHANAK